MENRGSLEDRLERLESIEEIRSLAARYCLALDMRATDAWGSLFPADVQVGKGRSGRAALAEWFRETMGGKFTGTAHVTGNHIIEFDGPDRARGVVYSRNEHETGDYRGSLSPPGPHRKGPHPVGRDRAGDRRRIGGGQLRNPDCPGHGLSGDRHRRHREETGQGD